MQVPGSIKQRVWVFIFIPPDIHVMFDCINIALGDFATCNKRTTSGKRTRSKQLFLADLADDLQSRTSRLYSDGYWLTKFQVSSCKTKSALAFAA